MREYVGGYDDWVRQAAEEAPAETGAKQAEAKVRRQEDRPRRLTWKEERELEALPDRIAALEEEQGRIHAAMADPGFYRNSGGEVSRLNGRLTELEEELMAAFARWEELEGLRP